MPLNVSSYDLQTKWFSVFYFSCPNKFQVSYWLLSVCNMGTVLRPHSSSLVVKTPTRGRLSFSWHHVKFWTWQFSYFPSLFQPLIKFYLHLFPSLSILWELEIEQVDTQNFLAGGSQKKSGLQWPRKSQILFQHGHYQFGQNRGLEEDRFWACHR